MPENVRQNIYSTLSLLYFYNLFSYSAIQPQVCDKLSVQCSVFNSHLKYLTCGVFCALFPVWLAVSYSL